MNIREEYQLEMKKVKPAKALNDKILNQAASGQTKMKKRIPVFPVGIAAAAVILIVLFGSNFQDIKAFASSFFGNFVLEAGNKHMELGDLKPVQIDLNKFISQEGTHLIDGSTDAYVHNYSSIEECKKQTGLQLWDSDQISVSWIDIVLDVYGQGEITCEFKYQGKRYSINGMFMTKEREQWGYGTELAFYRTYSYGNGKKAYFVKNKDLDGEKYSDMQDVYFTANHVMYQLFTKNSKTGTKKAEELIDIIAANDFDNKRCPD